MIITIIIINNNNNSKYYASCTANCKQQGPLSIQLRFAQDVYPVSSAWAHDAAILSPEYAGQFHATKKATIKQLSTTE